MLNNDWQFPTKPRDTGIIHEKIIPQTIKFYLIVWNFCFYKDIFFIVGLTYGCQRSWKRKCSIFVSVSTL